MCVADEAQDARTDLQTNAEIAPKQRHRSIRSIALPIRRAAVYELVY